MDGAAQVVGDVGQAVGVVVGVRARIKIKLGRCMHELIACFSTS